MELGFSNSAEVSWLSFQPNSNVAKRIRAPSLLDSKAGTTRLLVDWGVA